MARRKRHTPEQIISSRYCKDCGRNTHFRNKVTRIQACGLDPIITFPFHSLTEDEAYIIEVEEIARIGRKDLGKGPLVNWSDGGEGPSGMRHSQEARTKISMAVRGDSRRTAVLSVPLIQEVLLAADEAHVETAERLGRGLN